MYPDGLESRREYDEPGRLVSRHRAAGRQYATATMTRTVSYGDDNGCDGQHPADDLEPLRELLAFTDCSGYQTRYEYDRFAR